MVSMVQYKTRKLYLAQSTHASTRTTQFCKCAHGYFYGYLTVCNGIRYGCETHTLPELAENGILVK